MKQWRNAAVNGRAGTVSFIKYRIAGRTRRIYGRARRWAPTIGNRILGGYSEIVAEFQRADRLYYDDVARSEQIDAAAAIPTGFVTPLVFPLSTLEGAPRSGTIADTGGDVPAPFVAQFIGPQTGSATQPKLSGTGWEIQLDTTLLPGQVITVDTRPWAYRALRNDGANLSGKLTAKSRLAKARIDNEGDTLWFDTTDASGTARCVVSWYPTYDSL